MRCKMKAYILITVKTGSERGVYENLNSIKGVEEVNELYGGWDLIVKVDVESPEDLDALLTENIRAMKEIEKTSTMIVAQYKH